jgi:hypothetical protein
VYDASTKSKIAPKAQEAFTQPTAVHYADALQLNLSEQIFADEVNTAYRARRHPPGSSRTCRPSWTSR